MLTRVKDVGKYPEVFHFTSNTFYFWKAHGFYPQIFCKLGTSLFVDSEKLDELIKKGRLSEEDYQEEDESDEEVSQ